MKKDDNWNTPVSIEDMENLDEDLINQLNEKYDGHDTVETTVGRSKGIRVVGLITALALIVLAFNNLFMVFNIPPLGFVQRSRQLVQDPEIHKLREAVVIVSSADSRGTGFNIDKNGLIITNNHVIKNAGIVNVSFTRGPLYTGKIWANFPEIDLAVIRIEGENLPVIEIETETELVAGDEVLIIGNPLWLSFIVTEGEVVGSAVLKGWDETVLMIRAPIHKGSSGSPVINSEGRVAAVIFATVQTEQEEIIGLAVPINNLFRENNK
ncbi:MAG: trypsin-like peptidase domain-containing protein [Clostridiales bacterium]|jgi:S1-C subfamily serine protease|nr:trypsin-like peptidase domain-containing protein [Clostridiales bacterium]